MSFRRTSASRAIRTISIALVVAAGALQAQNAPDVAISQGPPDYPFRIVYGYSGSNLIYTCYAPSTITSGARQALSFSISAATAATPGVFTTTGHGMDLNTRPSITVVGGTGNWAAANGTWVAHPLDANTFTLLNASGTALDTSTFGAVTGTLTWTTTSALLNQPVWAVVEYFYDGSSNLIGKAWVNGSTGIGVKCTDATSTTNNLQ